MSANAASEGFPSRSGSLMKRARRWESTSSKLGLLPALRDAT